MGWACDRHLLLIKACHHAPLEACERFFAKLRKTSDHEEDKKHGNGTFGRYVMTRRTDAIFKVDAFTDEFKCNKVESEEDLYVCRNCLATLDYQGYHAKKDAQVKQAAVLNFDIIAGCDKTRETCQSKFTNIINFRGEPDVPGVDKLLTTAGTLDKTKATPWSYLQGVAFVLSFIFLLD